jgi:hypothetical protein
LSVIEMAVMESIDWVPRWSWFGVAEDFARVQILLTVFDGDPDKWLEMIRTSGTLEDQADVPFLMEMKQRMEEDSEVIDDMRRIVREFAERVSRIGE